MAAKASSYYSLTPASSTTSLNDFSVHISNETALNNKKQLKKKPATTSTLAVSSLVVAATAATHPVQAVTLLRTSSKKRTRTNTVETPTAATTIQPLNQEKEATTSAQQSTNTATEQTVATAVRRRGRPPKNSLVAPLSKLAPAQQQQQQSNAAPIAKLESISSTESASTVSKPAHVAVPVAIPVAVPVPVAIPVHVPVVTQPEQASNKNGTSLMRYNSIDSTSYSRTATNNKLIKSLINKCSSNSNLQKSKVAAETTPESAGVLTNKINKSNNVNTKPQPQITDYLVENKYQQQQKQQENLSDIENQNCLLNRTPTKTPSISNLHAYQIKDLKYLSTASNTVPIATAAAAASITEQDPFPTTPMPKLSWANNNELWQVMRRKEIKYIHDSNYLKRHLNIEPQMRAILLDWLVEISYAYRLHRETWYLALEYMDRFLTCSKQQMRVDRLQLIGMTSLFLAAKVEEIYPPKLKELAGHMESYSSDNEDAISQFELFMLKTLNWEISPVTANTWLMTYLQIASINYYSILNQENTADKTHDTNMVMPLNIYKNSNLSKFGLNSANNQNGGVSPVQQQFYLDNYMKYL